MLMQEGPNKKCIRDRRLLFFVVGLALLANGLVWAVRVPPMHPSDEPQHFLYASLYDGVRPEQMPEGNAVPRDLQAFAEMVDFGPHRTIRRTIDLSESRADELAMLRAEADDPAMAAVFVPDSEENLLISHPRFNDYHPPTYYALTGQVLKLGHGLGLGVRGRLLMGRLFSVGLSLIAAWLAVLLARGIWPDRWSLPALVGLATGWQALVAFYTSAVNSDALTYVLFTAFLLLGTRMIVRRPSVGRVVSLVGTGLLAVSVKITMIVLLPMGLIALVISKASRRMRIGAWAVLAIFFVASLSWLLIPLSGGESVVSSYGEFDTAPRSFPAEMFASSRLYKHLSCPIRTWGKTIGNSVGSDVVVPRSFYRVFVFLTGLAILSGLALLRKADAPQRRILIWLGFAPLITMGLFYVIDYRFVSMGTGGFLVRGQYYVPTAAAQMVWIVWGLTGWFKGKALPLLIGGFASLVGAYNLWVLVAVVCPRYYGQAGWWAQCEQIAMLWPLPGWSVAALDIFAAVTAIAGVIMLVACSRREAVVIRTSSSDTPSAFA